MEIEIIQWKQGNTLFAREDQMQAAQIMWWEKEVCQYEPEWRQMLFHVDNNSWNAVIGARKKALGVSRGSSDLILVLFGETVYIENKLPDGVWEEKQQEFARKVLERGQRYVLCYSFEGFKKFIMREITKL